jgi:hypothetical protein
MVHKKIIRRNITLLLLLLAFSASGCASIQDVHQEMLKSLRTPGETMDKSPEETESIYLESCRMQSSRNLVHLEAEVIPNRVADGNEVNHRITYSVCKSGKGNIDGEIIRKVYYGNAAVFQDRTRYVFKPGTWIVDAFIKVPEKAGPGKYEVDTVVSYGGKSKRVRNTFEVRKRDGE